MPSNVVKSISDKTNKSINEIEKLWEKAKEITAKKLSKNDQFFWATVSTITKRLAGLKESLDLSNLADFIIFEDESIEILDDVEKMTHLSTSLALIDSIIFVDSLKLIAALQKIGLNVKTIDYLAKETKNDVEIIESSLVFTLAESIHAEQIDAVLSEAKTALISELFIEDEDRKINENIFVFEYDLPAKSQEGNEINAVILLSKKYDFVFSS